MVFTVISMNCRSGLLIVEGSINADPYKQDVDRVGFINTLDQKHGLFG
jgi:hypothetical protein